MFKYKWHTFCRAGIVDKNSDLPTLIGIFQRYNVPLDGPNKAFGRYDTVALAVQWFEPEPPKDYQLWFEVSVGKSQLARVEVEVHFRDTPDFTTIVSISGFPLSHKFIDFDIYDESDNRIKRIRLPIIYTGAPRGVAPP